MFAWHHILKHKSVTPHATEWFWMQICIAFKKFHRWYMKMHLKYSKICNVNEDNTSWIYPVGESACLLNDLTTQPAPVLHGQGFGDRCGIHFLALQRHKSLVWHAGGPCPTHQANGVMELELRQGRRQVSTIKCHHQTASGPGSSACRRYRMPSTRSLI